MKTFHYTCFQKRRGYSKRYAGDGIVTAEHAQEARKLIAYQRNVPACHIILTEQKTKE
jgi:hypothetical protein